LNSNIAQPRYTVKRSLNGYCTVLSGGASWTNTPSRRGPDSYTSTCNQFELTKVSWNGYKLHLDTADCGVPIAALLSSASMHDSRAAIPLSLISASRVTNLYDLMDAAYCSSELRDHSRSLGHVPLIDHNPRGGEKIEFAPAEATRYNERTAAERSNARLKDELGGNHIMVKGSTKVMGASCKTPPASLSFSLPEAKAEDAGGHFWHDAVIDDNIRTPARWMLPDAH
jgi:hypothetical protein